MGAGKSTIGRRLAKKLKLQFFDSDHEIEKRTGARITLIFEIEGEAGFRKREAEVIDEVTRYNDIVLATGGGVVLDELNRQHLRERGIVVYLRADAKQLLKRTGKDSKRPLLNTPNPLQTMEELMKVRAPLYESIADLVIDTDHNQVQHIVDKIVQKRNSACGH